MRDMKSNEIKKRQGKLHLILFLLCACIFIYFLIDYLNLPSNLGFSINRINFDALNVISGIFVAIFIFILSYYCVEKWNIKKQQNQEKAIIIVLIQIYENCKQGITLLHKGGLQFLVKHTDFQALYDHNSPAYKYADSFFGNEQFLLHFFAEGIVPHDIILSYFKIKQDINQHLTMSVALFDHIENVIPTQDDLILELDSAINTLKQYEDTK